MDALGLLKHQRIVPVVVIDNAQHAVAVAQALLDGGLSAIEVTLRTDAALSAVESIAKQVPDMLVGVGSVRTPKHLEQAQHAGARFSVSPGSTEALLATAKRLDMPFVPGAVTPSESLALLDAGYQLQKLFPAELSGGTAYISALQGPIPEVRFFPTGGIRAETAEDYLALSNVACIGGSWLTPAKLQQPGQFDNIRQLAAAARQLVAG